MTLSMHETQLRVVQSFIGRSVHENTCSPVAGGSSSSYSVAFPHTDFIEPLHASFVTDVALCVQGMMVSRGLNPQSCDVLVGEADRLLGAILHEVSVLTQVPYSLINWYPEGSRGEIVVQGAKGFSGKGVSYLNGIRPGMRAVIIGDTFEKELLVAIVHAVKEAGAVVQHATFLTELVPNRTSQDPSFSISPDLPSLSILAKLDVDPETKQTVLVGMEPIPIEWVWNENKQMIPPSRRLFQIETDLPSRNSEVAVRTLASITSAFIDIPIQRNPMLQYPYSFFQLTDFVPLMQAPVVESMCDMSLVYAQCLRPGAVDLLVSECDRGGGPLVQGIAHRLAPHVPFVMAMWSTRVQESCAVQAQVGFSGNGSLVVNGISTDQAPRVVFVDDMLSSGGTAEGVLRAVEAAGGIPVEAVFVSEKLYMDEAHPRKGYERLKKLWPSLIITTLIQFAATGDRTSNASVE